MHPVRKRRLIFIVFILLFASTAFGFFGYAFKESIDLYYMPARVIAEPPPVGKQFKAGGCVLPGSLKRLPNSLTKTFIVTDGIEKINVKTEQILPDLFDEGESTVLTGKLDEQGVFVASQVLAKHDENYMPPEVADGLHDGEGPVKNCDNIY